MPHFIVVPLNGCYLVMIMVYQEHYSSMVDACSAPWTGMISVIH